MEVKVISSEMIKPSSPTPSHLRSFKLSFLDQLQSLDASGSINFFYLPPTISSSSTTTTMLADQLKVSLSKTLTRFYPLAARVTEDNIISIECNDEGALFTHVELSCHMSNFLKQPIDHNLLHHTGSDSDDDASGRGVQIAVRLNVFACGGICIGVRFLHKIIDGATISTFLKSWAAAATTNAASSASDSGSGCDSIIHEDDFSVASKLFPPNETHHKSAEMTSSMLSSKNTKKGVWGRFIFDAKAITTLKSIFTQDNQNPYAPSSVILVSSFVLKHVILAASASASASASQKQYILLMPVNMRPRMDPPLSQNSIGNMVWYIGVLSPLITSNKEETTMMMMKKLVAQQREAIAEINGDFLKRFQGEGGHDVMKKVNLEKSRTMFGRGVEVEMCSCTSWCKFGFNEFDFGWGKPLWYCSDARVPSTGGFVNHFLLIDTPSGDGIEAQLMLDEADMNILKLDQDFLAFASISPTILP